MADASLDDFFAKKDKSKKKPKKQIIDPENLVEGEPQKKSGKKKKDKSKKKKENENKDDAPAEETKKKLQLHSHHLSFYFKEENEWNDFEENTVDLTGLRIAALQAKQEKEEEEQNGEEDEEGEDGDGERRPKTQDGPWQSVSENADGYAPPPPPEAEPAKATPVVGGKYVPPSRRGLGTESVSKVSRRKKEAPNIKSDLDFPTLGLGGKPYPADGGGRFEEVSGSRMNRQTEDHSKRTQALELGNKFGALTDNHN